MWNKDFCKVIMFLEDTKILEFNQYQKPNKAPFIFYADPDVWYIRLTDVK